MTEPLYVRDPYLRESDARVVATTDAPCSPLGSAPPNCLSSGSTERPILVREAAEGLPMGGRGGARQQVTVPKPVALVLDHRRGLLDKYTEVRPKRDPEDALAVALSAVLSADDLDCVRDFLAGELDGLYAQENAEETGETFKHWLIALLESHASEMMMAAVATDEFDRIGQSRDIVTLAERLATDVLLAAGFRAALDGENEALMRVYLRCADVEVGNMAAHNACTEISKQAKIDQAVKVLQILAANAENQAIWCEAIISMLKS